VFGLKLRSDIQNRFLSWAYTVPNSLKKAYPESTVSVVAVIRTHSKPFRAGLSMGNCRKIKKFKKESGICLRKRQMPGKRLLKI
jgi:hypothetical protein